MTTIIPLDAKSKVTTSRAASIERSLSDCNSELSILMARYINSKKEAISFYKSMVSDKNFTKSDHWHYLARRLEKITNVRIRMAENKALKQDRQSQLAGCLERCNAITLDKEIDSSTGFDDDDGMVTLFMNAMTLNIMMNGTMNATAELHDKSMVAHATNHLNKITLNSYIFDPAEEGTCLEDRINYCISVIEQIQQEYKDEISGDVKKTSADGEEVAVRRRRRMPVMPVAFGAVSDGYNATPAAEFTREMVDQATAGAAVTANRSPLNHLHDFFPDAAEEDSPF